ncbi:MAG TPA: HEAT repeat domain-containing protein [Planctomycetota bacterium]
MRKLALVLLALSVLALGARSSKAEDMAAALDALLPDMGSEDVKKQQAPQQKIQQMAYNAGRPGADEERVALCKAMAAKIGEGTPVIARVWLLRQIEAIGRAEVVDAVAACLKDKDVLVKETARRCLQNNPTPEASKVLVAAMEGADTPAWKAALIDSLGYRKNAADAAVIIKQADNADDAVRSSAVAALANIGDKSALEAVAGAVGKGSEQAKRVETDSYLLLADRIAAAGDKATALGVYKKLIANTGHVKCASIIGLGKAGGIAELSAIFEAMEDKDVRVRGAGLEALCLIQGPEVVKAICDKVKTAPTDMKIMLLRALILKADAAALPTFVACAEDANEDVKIEALKGIGAVGDAGCVPLLVKVAVAGGKTQDAARLSLDLLKGKEVDAAMIAALGNADPKSAAELIRSLTARKAVTSTPALLKSLESADAGVRTEAWKGLGALADAPAVPQMVKLLSKADQDGERNEAIQAIVLACKRQQDADVRAQPVLDGVAGAQGPTKIALLNVLGRIGGNKSLEALRAAIKTEETQEAAVRAMSEWPDAAVADDLLGIAKGTGPEVRQILALRGYIKVIGLPSGRPAAESLKLYKTGLDTAKRLDEKKLVLSGLAEVKDYGAFQMVEPFLAEEATKEEAAQALVKIAEGVPANKSEEVRPALQKILETVKNRDAKNKAKEQLEKKFKAKAK